MLNTRRIERPTDRASSGASGTEQGFTLIELMVAITVALIISGSIYTLLSFGQKRFVQDPALVDRQQNIRFAMDLIERDLVNAGVGMDQSMQIFTPGLDGKSTVAGVGDYLTNMDLNVGAGTYTSNGHLLGGGGVNDPKKPDFLEFRAHDGSCPDVWVNNNGQNANSGGNNVDGVVGDNIELLPPVPSCMPDDTFQYLTLTDGTTITAFAHVDHGNANAPMFNYPQGLQPPISDLQCGASRNFRTSKNGGCNGNCQCFALPLKITHMSVVRYEVAYDPTDVETTADKAKGGTPSLYRSESGGLDATNKNVYVPAPGPAGGWQMVARGIEDLQVVYFTVDRTTGSPVPWNVPPAVVKGNWETMVKAVRVTLVAKALLNTNASTVGASRASGNNVSALRGHLTRTVMLPGALMNFALVASTDPTYGKLHWQ